MMSERIIYLVDSEVHVWLRSTAMSKLDPTDRLNIVRGVAVYLQRKGTFRHSTRGGCYLSADLMM